MEQEQEQGQVQLPAVPRLAARLTIVALLCSAAVSAVWSVVHVALAAQAQDIARLFLGHLATSLLSALMLLLVVHRQVLMRLRGV
ncbi:MAG TPA: hypothetical protein VFW67_09285, partial [Burkholderiaceae bacterium]|nr:hypothetical protein [Burkholderiaceae bacterium]